MDMNIVAGGERTKSASAWSGYVGAVGREALKSDSAIYNYLFAELTRGVHTYLTASHTCCHKMQ